jgi:hypothetical protein
VTGYTRWEEDLTGEDPRFCNSDGDQLGYVKPNGTAWEAGYGGKLLGLRASKGKAVRRQLFLWMDDNYFSGSATTITPDRRQLLLDPARGAERRRQSSLDVFPTGAA